MKKNKLMPYLYSFPALCAIGLIVLLPILYTGYISLTNMNVYHWFDYKVIGFDNYMKALLVLDSGFLTALLRTVAWTVVNMVFQLVPAFLIALALGSEGLRFRTLYKTLLMFPWAMPGYVSILLWRMGIYNSEFGLLNNWLRQLGITPVGWLNNSLMAFICCTLVNIWLAMPFMIMVIDGALQSIDRSYYESAIIDGAGFFVRITRITVPLLRPIIAPAVMMTVFTTFKQFDIIYLLTMQQGAKTGADIHTVITYAYEKAFITNNYGYSSAISIIIFAILVLSSLAARGKGEGSL